MCHMPHSKGRKTPIKSDAFKIPICLKYYNKLLSVFKNNFYITNKA